MHRNFTQEPRDPVAIRGRKSADRWEKATSYKTRVRWPEEAWGREAGDLPFLGFTHIRGRSRRTGCFTVHRKTMGKRMAAKLNDIGHQLRQRMHESIEGIAGWLTMVVRAFTNIMPFRATSNE